MSMWRCHLTLYLTLFNKTCWGTPTCARKVLILPKPVALESSFFSPGILRLWIVGHRGKGSLRLLNPRRRASAEASWKGGVEQQVCGVIVRRGQAGNDAGLPRVPCAGAAVAPVAAGPSRCEFRLADGPADAPAHLAAQQTTDAATHISAHASADKAANIKTEPQTDWPADWRAHVSPNAQDLLWLRSGSVLRDEQNTIRSNDGLHGLQTWVHLRCGGLQLSQSLQCGQVCVRLWLYELLKLPHGQVQPAPSER